MANNGSEMNKSNRTDILFATGLVGLIVAGFAVQVFVWPRLVTFGIVPRTSWGLVGIPLMPFLHSNLKHLLANLSGLVILLGFVFAFYPRKIAAVTVQVILFGGILLWLFGRPATHVGASGLIYGLAAFIVVSAISQKKFLPIVAAIGVCALYGSSLFWGLVPIEPGISWDGHLAGGLAGVFVGRKGGRK